MFFKRSDESNPKISEMENTGIQDCVDIDVIINASTLHQHANI